MWMKSKEAGSKVQERQASSSSKRQLGGAHSGWIGERSVPITEAEGNWSAKSLGGELVFWAWC